MNKTTLDSIENIIKENFNDTRSIKCQTPEHVRKLDENVHPGGEIFTTSDGEFIDFELQLKDFDEEELTKYIEFAENLYEKHQKRVSIYLLFPKDIKILVKECPIKSEADFNIKLSCLQENPCHMILMHIKRKLRSDKILDCDDMAALEMLPVMCKREERNYFRLETLKIINGHYP